MYTLCIQYVYNMYTICIQYVYNMYTICIQYVYNMYTICIQYAYKYKIHVMYRSSICFYIPPGTKGRATASAASWLSPLELQVPREEARQGRGSGCMVVWLVYII